MILKFSGIIKAVDPIVHFGDEKTGSSPVLRSIQVLDENGRLVRMPFIAGNAIRGHLRRLLIRDFLERVGYAPTSTGLHHALYSGGVLESTSEDTGKINLELRREIRDTLPPIALLGTAIGNQMIDSSLRVGHAWPICRENRHRLPEELQNDHRASIPVRALTDTTFHTRRDDLRAERDEDEQAIQMLVDFETFIPGTAFYHQFALEYPSELEVSCFGWMLRLWGEHPWIGGKSGVGYGRVEFSYSPEPPSPDLYLDFCSSERERIAALLDTLSEMLK